jgi:hypothetical protein
MFWFKQVLFLLLIWVFVFETKAQTDLFSKTYDDYGGWEAVGQIIELIKRTIFYQDYQFISSTRLFKSNNKLFINVEFQNLDSNLNGQGFYSKGVYLDTNTDTLQTFDIKYHYFANERPIFRAKLRTSQGGFLTVASHTWYTGSSLYLFANDSLGNLLWVKDYPQLTINIAKILETEDKGYLLVGHQFEYDSYTQNNPRNEPIFNGHPERLWYAKIDSVGNLKWQHLLTGPGYELYDTVYYKFKVATTTRFRDAIKTFDGNYVSVGYIAIHPYIIKTDTAGNKLWERKYFKQLSVMDSELRKAYFYSVEELNQHLYVLGAIDSVENGIKGNYYFLMKLTASGKVIWIRYIKTDVNDYLYRIYKWRGGFMLTGSKQDNVNRWGMQDGWILKLDTNGCLFPGCNSNDVLDTLLSDNHILMRRNEVSIFPNPSSEIITVQTQIPYKHFRILSLTGQSMLRSDDVTEKINISNLPQGLYFIQLLNSSGNSLYTQKISILR